MSVIDSLYTLYTLKPSEFIHIMYTHLNLVSLFTLCVYTHINLESLYTLCIHLNLVSSRKKTRGKLE
jgi:hypothetical protein